MKPEELMIGDWVLYEGSPNMISEISEEIVGEATVCFVGNRYMANIDEVEPIPLTTEILKKNGFICVQNADEDEGEYECWQFRQGCVQIDYEPQVKMFEVHNGGEYNCGVRTINYYTDEDIIYIHQLQHAMHMCRIEKEIVL